MFRMDKEMQELLEKEVWEALCLYKNNGYEKDPWLWDLDWTPASTRGKRRQLMLNLVSKVGREDTEFPAWLQLLVNETEDGQPYLDISTSKRFVPKVLRLTWKGYPMHFDTEHKWGYLMPCDDINDIIEKIQTGDIETDFPLAQYYESISKEKSSGYKESTNIFVDQIADFSGYKSPVSSELPDPKEGIDVGIPGEYIIKTRY